MRRVGDMREEKIKKNLKKEKIKNLRKLRKLKRKRKSKKKVASEQFHEYIPQEKGE